MSHVAWTHLKLGPLLRVERYLRHYVQWFQSNAQIRLVCTSWIESSEPYVSRMRVCCQGGVCITLKGSAPEGWAAKPENPDCGKWVANIKNRSDGVHESGSSAFLYNDHLQELARPDCIPGQQLMHTVSIQMASQEADISSIISMIYTVTSSPHFPLHPPRLTQRALPLPCPTL